MGKGDNKRSNKEVKKPKQAKPKAPAAAESQSARPPIVVAGKKVK